MRRSRAARRPRTARAGFPNSRHIGDGYSVTFSPTDACGHDVDALGGAVGLPRREPAERPAHLFPSTLERHRRTRTESPDLGSTRSQAALGVAVVERLQFCDQTRMHLGKELVEFAHGRLLAVSWVSSVVVGLSHGEDADVSRSPRSGRPPRHGVRPRLKSVTRSARKCHLPSRSGAQGSCHGRRAVSRAAYAHPSSRRTDARSPNAICVTRFSGLTSTRSSQCGARARRKK
jgi:hypothetical protein